MGDKEIENYFKSCTGNNGLVVRTICWHDRLLFDCRILWAQTPVTN